MPSRYERVRAAYEFLRARNGEQISIADFAAATDWAPATARTYVAKMLKPWLTTDGDGRYTVHDFNLTENQFIARLSQVRADGTVADESAEQARTREALAAGENSRVEFKSSIPDQTDKLAHEIAALATRDGGTIYVGVNDAGAIVGLSDAANTPEGRSAFRERVEGCARIVRPAIEVTVRFTQLGEHTIAEVAVPNGDAVVYTVKNVPYIRSGSQSRPAEPDEVDALYRARYARDA